MGVPLENVILEVCLAKRNSDYIIFFFFWFVKVCLSGRKTGAKALALSVSPLKNPLAPHLLPVLTMAVPIASLAPLQFPDGSASYTTPEGVKILGSVNGPIEINRRDALKPEEVALEVLVKPGVGTSGVGERYVEGILRGILGRVILGREKGMPRKGIVVTLVVIENKAAGGKAGERGGSVRLTHSLFGFSISVLALGPYINGIEELILSPFLVPSHPTVSPTYSPPGSIIGCCPVMHGLCVNNPGHLTIRRHYSKSIQQGHQNVHFVTCFDILVEGSLIVK